MTFSYISSRTRDRNETGMREKRPFQWLGNCGRMGDKEGEEKLEMVVSKWIGWMKYL